MQLPRVPGARENRWAHLLSGAPENTVVAPAAAETLEVRVARLEAEVAELRAALSRLRLQ
jgi:uncharacterized protein YceH (UPF0502 family)